MLRNTEEAYSLLVSLKAPDALLRHLQLVGKAADLLIGFFDRLKIDYDADLIRLGVAIHDSGKILFPEELIGPGSRHEIAGYNLMVAHNVQEEVARCCITHAAWEKQNLTFEELTVALSDKLWKGKREEGLELLVVDAIAAKMGSTRWDVFILCDRQFEEIASSSSERLARS